MSASNRDYKVAVDAAGKLSKQLKVPVTYWDGDKGEFVKSLNDLIGSKE